MDFELYDDATRKEMMKKSEQGKDGGPPKNAHDMS